MIIISGVAPKIAMRIVAFFVHLGAKLHIVKRPNHAIMKSVRSLNSYSTSIKKITKDRRLLVKLLVLSTISDRDVQYAVFCGAYLRRQPELF